MKRAWDKLQQTFLPPRMVYQIFGLWLTTKQEILAEIRVDSFGGEWIRTQDLSVMRQAHYRYTMLSDQINQTIIMNQPEEKWKP